MAVNLKSQRQVKMRMLNKLIVKLGLNDVNAGSVIDVLTDAVAQEDFAQYIQLSQVLKLTNLDALTGTDLDNKAFEFGLTKLQPNKANGKINILRPDTFVKVATTFYAGSPSPIIGNTTIDVNDASSVLISTSGTLILGRGTDNEEEVAYALAPVDNSNYYTYTLTTPLTKNHAIEESIILKQGSNETISAGTQVRVQSTGVSAEILFVISSEVTLLAGEDLYENAEVIAVKAGTSGNIPIKAIDGNDAFATPPFAGARAQNLVKFTTGLDLESEDDLKDRIKSHIQSLSRGVKEAIINAIVGLIDTEAAKRVVSVNVILPQSETGPVLVYLDDGTGFEPSFESQGYEEVLRNSKGGEQRLQLDILPLVKAQIENNLSEPYDMSGVTKTLIYNVGSQSETVTFATSDFEFPESATAEEIVKSINDKSTLIEARTSQVGKNVTINAKLDVNEDIQITGGTSNSILGLPTDLKSTLFLYVDDILKSKDGETAILDSQNQGTYNFQTIGAFPHTLVVEIDNKSVNQQTVTFQSANFIDTTAITPAELVTVINAQLAGIVANVSDNNSRVRLSSNTLLSSVSAIKIISGSANDATNGLNFVTTVKSGINGDYTLNKELGTIEFKDVLPANVSVTAGSLFTRAKLRATVTENYSPVNGETLIISVDSGANQTITFDASFVGGKSATDTATFINSQLRSATAISREIGTNTYIEINSNMYDSGTIEIKSASTSNASFGFDLDVVKTSQRPHQAYQITQNAGPYVFKEGDSLVTVADNDIVNSTFSVVMDYDGVVTAAADTQTFTIGSFINVFGIVDVLKDFHVAFTSGVNTVSGNITSVSLVSGTEYKLSFTSLPANLANISINDLVKIEDLTNVSNNGFFLVKTIDLTGNGFITVENSTGVAESGSTGTALMSQKRIVDTYNETTGQIVTTAVFANTPLVTEGMIVLPSSVSNVTDFMNNIKISSLSTKTVIEGILNNTKIQISSKKSGSNGYIKITGGSANDQLGFSTDIYRGLQGYSYYTGLLKLCHQTIYGDDTDLVSYPGIGAAGIKFIFSAPTTNEFSINVNVTLDEGVSIASLENEIKSSISGYVNTLGIGKDVIIEEIRCRVKLVKGVTDVVLNAPAANIIIADNELARTRDSLILIG